ncbi:MAG: N-6 DNA methylase [Polyangiaceae bacterium]|nr:N-6 DNA methylase [Polyangiaceae bacterium]
MDPSAALYSTDTPRKARRPPNWEQSAVDIGKIAQRLIANISNLVSLPGPACDEFQRFLAGLRNSINPAVTDQDAIEMLAQHIITQPVFEALFDNYSFVKNNPVSRSLQAVVSVLYEQTERDDLEILEKLYSSVRMRVKGLDNGDARQKIVVELYEKFFSTAFKKVSEKLGIVYTPVEIVDFIIRSVEDVLQAEFGRSLTDENVHILDPFTGTGTFIMRLLQSGIIKPEDLTRKYLHEIHASEIVLLAYYIASINIENVYHELLQSAAADTEQQYVSFPGICLTDTFQLSETEQGAEVFAEAFLQNSERVQVQRSAQVGVIVGNPPYSIGQKSANYNAQSQQYPNLESRIRKSYVAASNATLNKAAYDAYIKAFRWASDRLDPKNGGIVAFVTNASWLDGIGLDGFRGCLEREFSSIYVYNLRGNCRADRELRQRESGNVFGVGTRTPVAVTVLVKRANTEGNSNRAEILYTDIGDHLSREDKLRIIESERSIGNLKPKMRPISPNQFGDWINARSERFGQFIPLGSPTKYDHQAQSLFSVHSMGTATGRDAWVHNFSSVGLIENVQTTIEYYNQQLDLKIDGRITEPDYDSTRGTWTRDWQNQFRRKSRMSENVKEYRTASYRPFCKERTYFDDALNQERYQLPRLFPDNNTKNYLISVSGTGILKEFSALITDSVPNLHFHANGQCFPLCWYESARSEIAQVIMFGEGDQGYSRRDAITDFAHAESKLRYGPDVTKEDIFFYVYGILHSPSYRIAFAADLNKRLPRLPLLDNPADFWAFSQAGRDLADLHINYESRPAPEGVMVNGMRPSGATFAPEQLIVDKMSFSSKGKKDAIAYNPHIRVSGIPLLAYDYVVNSKSPIEWVMERYCVSVHKESGIVNDANLWGLELGNPRYILDLLLSVIAVSVETVGIVARLPEVDWG